MNEELKEQLAENILKWTETDYLKWENGGSGGGVLTYRAELKKENLSFILFKYPAPFDIGNRHDIKGSFGQPSYRLSVHGLIDCAYSSIDLEGQIVDKMWWHVENKEQIERNRLQAKDSEKLINRIKKLIGK